MQSVVMHVDGAGVIWAMAKCRECCQVHKYLATDAISKGVTCNSCGHLMELAGVVIASSHPAQARAAGGKSDGQGPSPTNVPPPPSNFEHPSRGSAAVQRATRR